MLIKRRFELSAQPAHKRSLSKTPRSVVETRVAVTSIMMRVIYNTYINIMAVVIRYIVAVKLL